MAEHSQEKAAEFSIPDDGQADQNTAAALPQIDRARDHHASADLGLLERRASLLIRAQVGAQVGFVPFTRHHPAHMEFRIHPLGSLVGMVATQRQHCIGLHFHKIKAATGFPTLAQKLQGQNARFEFRLHLAFYQQGLRIRRGLNLSLLLRKQALQNHQRKHNGGQTQNGWQK